MKRSIFSVPTAGAVLALLVVMTASPLLVADDKAADKKNAPDTVPQAVRDLVGTYSGSWTLSGINDKGEAVKRMTWTDTIKAENPQVKDGRAFVTTSDEMRFEGRKGPPFKVEGKVGYSLEKEGAVGDYFIETAGQLHRMIKVAENVWSYSASASAQELAQLGFPKDASGQHVLVKVVNREGGIETHRISRLTTASWKDKDGKERWLQFVSLQGYHKRER